jgi:chromosome segregation ATPase
MATLFQRTVAAEAALTTLATEVERLQLENSVFQKFYEKKSMELGADEYTKGKKKKNKVAAKLLTVEQRVDVANVVHEDLLGEIESNRKNSEKMIDTLRAVLEETEIRIGELKRDAYEFKREVVVGAENARTGKIMAERVTRYFEDKLKQVDAVIEKLRLKNSTLKSQINKIEMQLAQKEEVGDSLHYIDFHQLQIENKQYVLKIEDRNEELLMVKLSTGKTIQVLNDYKKRLKEKLDEAEWLKGEVASKKSLLTKLEKEDGRVIKDLKGEKKSRNRLVQQIEEAAAMPNIEDYIQQKREMYELQSNLANWKKKVEIMEMAARKARSARMVSHTGK